MEVLLGIVAVLTVINSILLIAVAGSVIKVIRYMSGQETPPSITRSERLLDLPTGPLYRMVDGNLVQVGTPTYDMAVFNGKTEPYADGMDRRPLPSRNWDGISQQ